MGFSLDNKEYIFKWYETKTVNTGSNSFTTTNTIPVGAKLRVVDCTYGLEWDSPLHYSVSGNIITFTESSFSETIKFQIWCFI